MGGARAASALDRRSRPSAVATRANRQSVSNPSVWPSLANVLTLVGLLLAPAAAALVSPLGMQTAGVIGISLVFGFTGVGHFLRTAEMAQMLPPGLPARSLVIYATGVFELGAAAAVHVPVLTEPVSWLLVGFLVLVFPSNVDAARRRIPFGGHGTGPKYLWIRAPLQALLIAWVYAFGIAA